METKYTLTLSIGEAASQLLAGAGMRLVVAKSAGNAKPNVAWLAWRPARDNVVRWAETYGLYAAEAASRNGDGARVLDRVYPAADQRIYPFGGSAFGLPAAAPRVPPRHYDVHNTTSAAVAFGLLQDATVNGTLLRRAVNAAVVPPGFTADFTTAAKLYLWTQSAHPPDGVAPDVPDEATIVTLDPAHPAMIYDYDERTATFIRADGEELS
jgi:hypothetical protein